jgi:hypothetical protein
VRGNAAVKYKIFIIFFTNTVSQGNYEGGRRTVNSFLLRNFDNGKSLRKALKKLFIKEIFCVGICKFIEFLESY